MALLVVFLWATSWVLIKFGLQEIPPLTFAGLRYGIAALALIGAVLLSSGAGALQSISVSGWRQLALLGLLLYAVTQGAIFVALSVMPAVTVNLVWSFSTIVVAFMGIAWLAETPTGLQWFGVALATTGALIYFYPASLPATQRVGLIVAAVGVLANAGASILGRQVNRSGQWSPLVVTAVSMAFGACLLLTVGLAREGLPSVSLKGWAIILWLALVNTALAFTLWNHTLRALTALESSVINATMLIWIPVLAWLFLGETFTPRAVAGLVLAGIGTVLVQLRRNDARRVRRPGRTDATGVETTSAREAPGGRERREEERG